MSSEFVAQNEQRFVRIKERVAGRESEREKRRRERESELVSSVFMVHYAINFSVFAEFIGIISEFSIDYDFGRTYTHNKPYTINGAWKKSH